MSVCIRIKDAVKKYGDNTIISDLSLTSKKASSSPFSAPPAAEKRHFCV